MKNLTQNAFCRMLRQEKGLSAVEFALLSPVLVLASFATVDAGMAVYEEMMITNTLRSGAHLAISANSVAQVQTIVDTVAGDNFTIAGDTPVTGELITSVGSYCICPTDTSTQVGCATTCTGGAPPQQFYSIAASKDFDGIILPDFVLSGSIDVMAQ